MNRLIHTSPERVTRNGARASAKVWFDSDHREFTVLPILNGVGRHTAAYFTDDREDALLTAARIVVELSDRH